MRIYGVTYQYNDWCSNDFYSNDYKKALEFYQECRKKIKNKGEYLMLGYADIPNAIFKEEEKALLFNEYGYNPIYEYGNIQF
ncbi:MAG: hypothetical protein IJZ29_05285 [Clostridia bacterium]|nr:hypothetical protein [Clostridia bacterium]